MPPKTVRDVRREQALDRRRIKAQHRRRVTRQRKQVLNPEAVIVHNAVVTSLVPRISAAIDVWARKRVPLSVNHPTDRLLAYTDFTSIVLNIPEIEEVDHDMAGNLRGLAYHEAGHIIKTLPFLDLVERVMPLDSLATYAHRTQRDELIKRLSGTSKVNVHKAWNLLEDQRMESAMTLDSINLGRYYNVIVMDYIVANPANGVNVYVMIAGRLHVDATFRAAARQAFVETYGEEWAVEAETIINAYKATTNVHVMWQQVILFARYLRRLNGELPGTVDEHGDGETSPTDQQAEQTMGEGATQPPPPAPPMEGNPLDGVPEDTDDMGTGEDEGEAEEEDEDEWGSGVADREAEPDPDASGGEGAGKSVGEAFKRKLRTLAKEAATKGREERSKDQTINQDVRAFNEAKWRAAEGTVMTRVPFTVDPDPESMSKAIQLNRPLRNMMEQARAEAAPSWQVGTSTGVLDVVRYKTRQPGDMNFHRNYADDGDMALPNLAVSLVLDGSSSMSSHRQDLAIAAYGCKSACDVVGLPCTVTVYDTNAFLLWDSYDRPMDVPYDIVPSGGTDPSDALDALDSQQHGKANHLVIIMTDGQFFGRWARGDATLEDYAMPDRDLCFFWYKSARTRINGIEFCSTAEQIDDLLELPRFLNRYLSRAM